MVKKTKHCMWCRRLFLPARANQLYCSQTCYNADHYSAKAKPIAVDLRCPHNEHLICEVHSCSRCGWNPEVAKARLAAIIAKMKEDSNGQA